MKSKTPIIRKTSIGLIASVLIAGVPAIGGAEEAAASYVEHIKCETDADSGHQNCQIDVYLTRGFRAFSQCQVCHGLDANGSSFAPSLNQKLQEIDKARFMEVVTNGYTGQIGVMPGWKENPNVMKYVDNLSLAN